MNRDNPEQRLQMAVAQYLGHALKPPTIWTAFPAGGGGRTRGAFLKAMGLKAGWPDILVVHKFTFGDFDHFTLLLGIELKAGKGSQSAVQKSVMDSFRTLDMGYEVCHSIEDVQLALAHAGVPLHASMSTPVSTPVPRGKGNASGLRPPGGPANRPSDTQGARHG